MEILLISLLLGVCTGAVLALTGAGGTIIAVPLLIFGLHFTVAESAPIALLAVCVSSAIGALIALRQGRVRYRAAGFIAITGIVVAPAGIWLAQKLPNAPLTVLFALVLFYVAVNMLRQSAQPMAETRDAADLQAGLAVIPCRLEYEHGRLIWGWPCVRALGYSGIATGFISGLLGVGGGFVIVPALKKSHQPSDAIHIGHIAGRHRAYFCDWYCFGNCSGHDELACCTTFCRRSISWHVDRTGHCRLSCAFKVTARIFRRFDGYSGVDDFPVVLMS